MMQVDRTPSVNSTEPRERLKGKTAIVTGAASGFGLAIAATFARNGARVVLADVNVDRLEAAAQELRSEGHTVIAQQVDVSSGDDVRRAVEVAEGNFGRVNVFVNNAGVSHAAAAAAAVEEDEFDRVFSVNVKSLYWCARHATPRMPDGGVVLNVASAAAIRPRPNFAWYCASKGAVVVGSKALALELAPRGIRVCCICPTAAETPLMVNALRDAGSSAHQTLAHFAENIPLRRLCEASDVASAALFLASDEASFLTGVALEVDGGRCI